MKIIAIIQARMGATRLPGKMMKDLSGQPVVAHVINRVKMAASINELWLATTIREQDNVLAVWAEEHSVRCFRGSENNVLDRYYQTALKAEADVVVRITADCPLLDYQIVDQVVNKYLEGGSDYVCNTQPPTFPDGLDVEIFSFGALEKAWKEAKLKSEHEHVTPYIWKQPKIFKIKNVNNSDDLSHHRWTLDTPEDLELIRKVVKEMSRYDGYCGLECILQIIEKHPDWQEINSKYMRNDGYQKSVEED